MDICLEDKPQMLIIPIGIQGSGKTYTAINLRSLLKLNRASFDDVVSLISGYGNFRQDHIPVYASAVRGVIYTSLLMGFSAYIDMMNLTVRHRLYNIQPARLIRFLAREGYLKLVYEQNSLSDAINVLANLNTNNTNINNINKNIKIRNVSDQELGDVGDQELEKELERELERIAFYAFNIINTKKEKPQDYEQFIGNLENLIDRVSNLKIVGILYEIPLDNCWQKFLEYYEKDNDKQAYTKAQWWKIIQKSIKKYEPPSIDEGFDKIIRIKTHENALETIVKSLNEF